MQNCNDNYVTVDNLPFEVLVVFFKAIVPPQKSGVDLARLVSREYFIDDCSKRKQRMLVLLMFELMVI